MGGGLLAYLKCGKTAPVDCVLKQSTASLLAANTYLRANGPCTTGANGERIVGKCGWGGPLIDGVEMKTLVPLAMYQGLMANVPILIGANREDIENTAAATAPSNRKVPPMCNPQTCSEQDFRAWGVGLGFDAATLDAFVQVYSDEENGIPSNVLVYLLATFAEEGEWKDDVLFFSPISASFISFCSAGGMLTHCVPGRRGICSA